VTDQTKLFCGRTKAIIDGSATQIGEDTVTLSSTGCIASYTQWPWHKAPILSMRLQKITSRKVVNQLNKLEIC
jgi:hypothetical protein